MERSSDQIFDELLVIRCQERDQEAIGLLWKRWQPRLLKWSFHFLKDQDQAYEVAQESWLSIFKSIHKLKDPAQFRFWAYRIVQRRAADSIKKLQRERRLVDETAHLQDTAEGSEYIKEDNIQIMLSAINDLPNLHQEMLRLFYLEKQPIRDIANYLDLPEGTVKSRLFYARKELKEKLKNTNHE